jgi:NADPH-dependent 2,4-dienoyl-CoA reductase/sulfur reductase-like enzyme
MSIQIVIIGGSDASISAGLRARELDSECEVTIVVADRFPNYSICGIPFYLSGEVPEVPDWRALAHRTLEELTEAGLSLLLERRVHAIDSSHHHITVVGADGQARRIGAQDRRSRLWHTRQR